MESKYRGIICLLDIQQPLTTPIASTVDLKKVHLVVITFRHQKNRQNGQQIRFVINKDHPKLCAVINLVEMVLRKIRLGHAMELPLAIYANKKEEVKYPTSAKMTEMMRKAVRTVYPDISKE